ncbi:MAG TPA: hypothetical protein VGR56_10345 [Nitrososphaerales archaeon]|nr:hypothetical protein [Nitrososphaerales archaeon]
MVKDSMKVFLADVVLLFALYSVFVDLQWRTGYATYLHSACPQFCSYSPSFSYSLLTQFFTLAGNGVRLTSPPTLDWVQLIVYALVVLNAWFAYKTLKSRGFLHQSDQGLNPA